MTCRTENGDTFKQDYNAENRISAIHKMSGGCTGTATDTWTYTYDGDGVRVSTAYFTAVSPNPQTFTAYYMGGSFEVTGSLNVSTFTETDTKSYYGIAGMTVAMKDSSGVQFLLTDHLGSVVATTDSTGTLISQQRYLPFGGARTDISTTSPTDFTYTGQRDLPGTGLMDYKARFYSPCIMRWLQPDTIIPGGDNPQNWNRYSYVKNNPVRYNDPTGHCTKDDDACKKLLKDIEKEFSVKINDRNGKWTRLGLTAIQTGMGDLQQQMGKDNFNKVFTGVKFSVDYEDDDRMGTYGKRDIHLGEDLMDGDKGHDDFTYIKHETVHELAHIWDDSCDDCMSKGMMTATGSTYVEKKFLLLFTKKEYKPNGKMPTNYPTNSREDWAESVTAFVYPSYATNNPWDQKRQDYVLNKLKGK